MYPVLSDDLRFASCHDDLWNLPCDAMVTDIVNKELVRSTRMILS